jgi:hypothetical protein
VLRWEGQDQEWTAVVHVDSGELEAAIAGWKARIVAERFASLDEVFVARAGEAAAPAEDG